MLFLQKTGTKKKEEVEFLMGLLAKTLLNELDEMHRENVKITFFGDLSKLNPKLIEITRQAEEKNKKTTQV